MHHATVRVSHQTYGELVRLAARLDTSVSHTVTPAVRASRQERMGAQLAAPLDDDESSWLGSDAD